MKTIDLNCDLGEGGTNESSILPFISSCSIACGGHYGDQETVHEAIARAKDYNVKIGAHPSYPDRNHFGRKSYAISPKELTDALRFQLDLFFQFSDQTNHIKPHGALYNDLAINGELTEQFLSTLKEYCTGIAIYCPPNSELSKASSNYGFYPMYEGFGDRAYNPNGSLVSRAKPGSVLTQAINIANQITQIITTSSVGTIDGKSIPLIVDTICLHGDTPGLSNIIQGVTRLINQNGIYVAGR